MKTLLILILAVLVNQSALADENVIYQYKKYEKFDLGDLEVKGKLIAPGDLSVRERERRRFELDLYNREHFDDKVGHDMRTLR